MTTNLGDHIPSNLRLRQVENRLGAIGINSTFAKVRQMWPPASLLCRIGRDVRNSESVAVLLDINLYRGNQRSMVVIEDADLSNTGQLFQFCIIV